MPFRSKSQQRWMFAAEARNELPKGTARRWAKETKKQKGGFTALPEKVPQTEKTAADLARIALRAVFAGSSTEQSR